MKKTFLGIIFLGMIALFSHSFAQGSLNIGVVDVDAIVKEMPEATQADIELKAMQQNLNDTLLVMQEDFMARIEEYQKQQGLMPPEKQQEEEQALKMLENQILAFRDQKLKEIQERREEYLDPIRKKMVKAIEEVAKEEKLGLVLDKASPSVLYSIDKYDITFRVLDRIKRGAE
jgi:outer membrane protein